MASGSGMELALSSLGRTNIKWIRVNVRTGVIWRAKSILPFYVAIHRNASTTKWAAPAAAHPVENAHGSIAPFDGWGGHGATGRGVEARRIRFISSQYPAYSSAK